MAKLVSMKIDRASQEEKMESAAEVQPDPYPYGLSLTLDEDALEKLGLDATDLEVGEEKLLIAKVTVTGISSRKALVGDDSQSVNLQITECCLEDAPTGKAATAALYGASDE